MTAADTADTADTAGAACTGCNTTPKRLHAHGLCARCYRAKRRAAGLGRHRIDGQVVADHIRRLRADGMRPCDIASAAGIDSNNMASMLRRITNGNQVSVANNEGTRMCAVHTANVPATAPARYDDPRIDSTPVVAHLKALIAAGWSRTRIAAESGVTGTCIASHLNGKSGRYPVATISADTAAAILNLKPEPPAAPPPKPAAEPRRTGEWVLDAACRAADVDPELFFSDRPDANGRHSYDAAKAICRRCPVRHQCLEHALATGEMHGVWGGLSPGERQQFHRIRKADTA